MLAIFLVGGLGTRLRPFTLAKPKALLPVLNRPFIAYQFDLLSKLPVTDVVLAAGLGHVAWEKEIRSLAESRFKIHFVYEKELLGTGGAIRLAYDTVLKKRKFPESPVLVFNGDVFFELDLRQMLEFHRKSSAQATIGLTRVKDPSRFGLVPINAKGKILRFVEKPTYKLPVNYVNGGIYVFEPAFIQRIKPGKVVSVERETFPDALTRHVPLYGFKTHGYWNDIGTTATYRDAHGDLLKIHPNLPETKYLRKRAHPRVLIGQNSKIHSDVIFEGFVSIGRRVVVEKGCFIKDSVLHDDVNIKEGTQIISSVVGPKSRIGHHVVLEENTFLGAESNLPPYSKT